MVHRPLIVLLLCLGPAVAAERPALDVVSVDQAAFTALPGGAEATRPLPAVVKAEVLLDRAHISPGTIDGIPGESFAKALGAYQTQMGLPASGTLDQATWDRLVAGAPAPLTTYEITQEDVKGPFTPRIPLDFEAQSRLKHLGYRYVKEELGERFHMAPSLLRALNPGARFRPGERIAVANVETEGRPEKAARVVVDKTDHNVEALAADGRLLAYYPASIGSTDKPAPTGDFTIVRIDRNPVYTYDPKYHFKGVHATKPFSIAPGPNNPVGLVWMDLGGDGYGIHGTPNPDAVGKTQSHGCIRLTNWSALDLAARVDKGTPVSFGDVPGTSGPTPSPTSADASPGPAESSSAAPPAGR